MSKASPSCPSSHGLQTLRSSEMRSTNSQKERNKVEQDGARWNTRRRIRDSSLRTTANLRSGSGGVGALRAKLSRQARRAMALKSRRVRCAGCGTCAVLRNPFARSVCEIDIEIPCHRVRWGSCKTPMATRPTSSGRRTQGASAKDQRR